MYFTDESGEVADIDLFPRPSSRYITTLRDLISPLNIRVEASSSITMGDRAAFDVY
jgi:hypothetical protein